jgi:hypothetical protein
MFEGTVIPITNVIRIIEINIDTKINYSAYFTEKQVVGNQRIPSMQAVAGSLWGQQKETLLPTYRGLIRPVLDYGAPIIFPNTSKTSVEKYKKVQNKSLRIALGCHQMASIQHLHSEPKMLPVDNHLNLLSNQFLARALTTDHVSNPTVNLPDGPRAMKRTLYSSQIKNLEPYLHDGRISLVNLKRVQDDLHHKAVSFAMCRLGLNKLL